MLKIFQDSSKGQSLIEVLIALSVVSLIIITAAGGLLVVLRSSKPTEESQTAASLMNALIANLFSVAESNWNSLYILNKGSANKYRLATSTGSLSVQSGEEPLNINGKIFTRYFYIDNVSRDAGGNIESVYESSREDPSTQKATTEVSYPADGASRILTGVVYLTRWRNNILTQTDWSGGGGQEGPVAKMNSGFASSAGIDFTSIAGSIIAAAAADCDDDECELVSSVFDSGINGGVAPNTIMWQGTQPAGAKVKFKIASSNSPTGPWSYPGAPLSPAGPNVQARINLSNHNNVRYFRYRAILEKNGSNQSPQVDDIIINWSP